MFTLILAIALTLATSAVCSLLEAMILSTTQTDIAVCKQKYPVRGLKLEKIHGDLEETISSILTLNTIANTLGSVLVGGIATKLYGETALGVVSGLLTFSILIFSEIIPKSLGVHYRRALHPVALFPLIWIRTVFRPVTFLTNRLMRLFRRGAADDDMEAGSEIMLLAEKGAKEGDLDRDEVNLIANSLSLASVRVRQLMTPRTVVIGAQEDEKLIDLLHRVRTIRFGRMPVYSESLDEITGLLRRRDILHAIAMGDGQNLVKELMLEPVFFPDVATASFALEALLSGHQQMGMVVDEFGGFVGVITIEDIVEHLIGKEIYENDDVAVDMRQLARLKSKLIGLHGTELPPKESKGSAQADL